MQKKQKWFQHMTWWRAIERLSCKWKYYQLAVARMRIPDQLFLLHCVMTILYIFVINIL